MEYTKCKEENIYLKQELSHQEALYKEKMKIFEDAQAKLSDKFKSLSLDALEKNNQQFLHLAKKTFEGLQESSKGDLEKKKQSIQHLVDPLKESLQKLDKEVQAIEKERKGQHEALKEQIKTLSESEKALKHETSNLVKALRLPDVRGRWGEVQLKRVVEMAGLLNYCDFYEQKQISGQEDGELRPDLIIHLPGDRKIIVDSKAPFAAFLEANQTEDEEKRVAYLQQHAKHLRHHIQALGKKAYWKHLDKAPEFVILFLPAETFFSAALQMDPSIIELSAQQGVVLATPTTLIGMLKAIAYGWKEQRLSENSEQVAKLGHELYKRLYDMNKHLAQLGRNLSSSVDTYNKTIGSFESRVLVSARKFPELGAASQEIEIQTVDPIDKITRDLKTIKNEN